jgi:hypothetical protein
VVVEMAAMGPRATSSLVTSFPFLCLGTMRTVLGVLAEREAKRFFVWFLASDLRVKLGKCRACSLYEIKTRKFYKAGTYCRRCKAKTSAGEITQKKRQELKRHRKETLTSVLKSWSEKLDPNDVAMRKRLAEEVNRRLRGQHKITSKWVKRNLRLALPT